MLKTILVYTLIFTFVLPFGLFPSISAEAARRRTSKNTLTGGLETIPDVELPIAFTKEQQKATNYATWIHHAISKNPSMALEYQAVVSLVNEGEDPNSSMGLLRLRQARTLADDIYKKGYLSQEELDKKGVQIYMDALMDLPGVASRADALSLGVKLGLATITHNTEQWRTDLLTPVQGRLEESHAELALVLGQHVARNPQIGVPVGLIFNGDGEQELIESEPALAALLHQIKTPLNKVNHTAADLKSALDSGLADVKAEMKENVKTIKNRLDAFEAKQAKAEVDAYKSKVKWEAASSSVFLISTIAGFSDPKLGHQIQTVGAATIKTAESIDKFAKTVSAFSDEKLAGMLVGCVNLVAGIGQAASMIFSLIGGGKSEAQMILEEIANVRKDIAELRKEMNDRFDQVDTRLTQIMDAVQQGFASMDIALKDINLGVRGIQNSINNISQTLSRMETSNYFYLRAGFQQPIEETLDWCLSSQPEMTLRDFEECVSRFETYATKHTTNELATGAAQSISAGDPHGLMGADEYFAALGRQLSVFPTLWDGIALITRAVEDQLGIAGVQPKTVQRGLVNAEQWARYSQLYSQFIFKNADMLPFATARTRNTTERILEVEGAIQQTIHNLAINTSATRTDANSTKGKTALQEALDQYQELSENLKFSVKNAISDYKASKLRGSGLYGEVEQINPAFIEYATQDVQPCDRNKTYPDSPAPSSWGYRRTPTLKYLDKMTVVRAIPEEVVMAAQMQLGSLRVCYSDLWWRQEGELKFKQWQPTNQHVEGNFFEFQNYGRLNITLQVIFTPVNSENNAVVWSKDFNLSHTPRHYATTVTDVTPAYVERINRDIDDRRNGKERGALNRGIANPNEIGPVRQVSYGFSVDPKSGDIDNEAPLRYDVAEEQWPQMNGRILNSGTPSNGEEVQKGIAMVKAARDKQLDMLRHGLLSTLRTDMNNPGSGMYNSVDGIGGVQKLMLTILATAYPSALENNDQLRSHFFGRGAILSSSSIVGQINGELTSGSQKKEGTLLSIDPDVKGNTFYSQNVSRVAELRKAIDALEQVGNKDQVHPMIESARASLELTQSLQAYFENRESIESVIRDIRNATDPYRDGVPAREE